MLKNKSAECNYSTPLINVSYIELTADERNQFRLGLEYSFIDKNKHIQKNLAVNFKLLAYKVTENLKNCKCEDFHELLCVYMDIFTRNIYTTHNTYKNLECITNDPNIAVVSSDKESSVVIMNRSEHFKKLQHMIDEGIQNGVYIVTEDRTLEDLITCSVVFYTVTLRNMVPISNQPGQLYGIAKTFKFDNTADITVDNLKICPIIAQSGTYKYNAAKVVANYLKLLCSNVYIILNTQEFAKIIHELDPLKSNEQYVSYNVESLFTNVPVHGTIEYIINEIYV